MVRTVLLWAATLIALAAFTLASILLTQHIAQGKREQAKVCRVAERNNTTLRSLLFLAQKNAIISLRGHPAKITVAENFYRDALGLIKPVDCEHL